MHGVLRCSIFSAWFLDIRTYQLAFILFIIYYVKLRKMSIRKHTDHYI